jgi:hypothetical protein
MRNTCKILTRKSQRNVTHGRPKFNRRIILKYILEKQEVTVGTGFKWLRIGFSGGRFEHDNDSGFIK